MSGSDHQQRNTIQVYVVLASLHQPECT